MSGIPGLVAAIAFLFWSVVMAYYVGQFGILTNHKVGQHRPRRSRWCPVCRDAA